jgi:hypothetical protein
MLRNGRRRWDIRIRVNHKASGAATYQRTLKPRVSM